MMESSKPQKKKQLKDGDIILTNCYTVKRYLKNSALIIGNINTQEYPNPTLEEIKGEIQD